MLEVISFILEETIKGDKEEKIADIKSVNFLWHILYLELHKTSVRLFLSAADVRMKQVNHRT